jgi:hypothetical protein
MIRTGPINACFKELASGEKPENIAHTWRGVVPVIVAILNVKVAVVLHG